MKVVIVAGGHPSEWPLIEISEMDYVVGVDRGCLNIVEKGWSLNLAVGDFDSVCTDEYQEIQKKAEKLIKVQAEKDETDTQLALRLVLEKFSEAKVIILGATGGRLDHFLANLWMPLEAKFSAFAEQIYLKDRHNSICYLLPGNHTIKKEKEMDYLSYCCLTPVKKLLLTGSKYTLSEQDVLVPTSYASNEFLTDEAFCSFEEGLLAVIQSKD